eukprot:3142243-Pyramimonas_sp.AAC.1
MWDNSNIDKLRHPDRQTPGKYDMVSCQRSARCHDVNREFALAPLPSILMAPSRAASQTPFAP